MHVTSRSYLTAGVAALGASAIALSPIQPIPNQVALAPEKTVSTLAVNLAAVIDPITPWVDTFGIAVENATRLNEAWFASTFPIFQTIATNQLVYAQEFPDIGLIFQQILNNVRSAFQAPFVESADNISTTLTTVATIGGDPALPLSQKDLYALLQSDLSPLPPEVAPLLGLMTTPFSGAALAVIGPVIGPVISMVNSVKATFAALKARNLPAAINEFLNLAPYAVNAFLNGGQILDLTKLVNRIAPLPDSVESIGLNMGGIVSSGLTPVPGAQTTGGVSGVMFDGLAAKASVEVFGLQAEVDDPGLSVGPIGATQLLTRKIADAIKVTPPPTAATVAPAAAEAAPVAVEVAALEAEAASVADEAPAPKRQSRAASHSDNGGSDNGGRSSRGARNSR